MALEWRWKEKRGQIIGRDNDGKKFSANIYEGNAPLIALSEWDEGGNHCYAMYLFFVDDEHAKKCLGLKKNACGEKRNLYPEIEEVRLSKNHSHYKEIMRWFDKAYDNIVLATIKEDDDDDDFEDED